MGIDFFREETDWAGARSDVLAWGYPRPVGELEAEAATWVRCGENILCWFLQGPEPESLSVHICAAPEARGHLGTERQMLAIEVVGELLGAKRLWGLTGLPGEYPSIPREHLRQLLSERGWTNAERGTFKDLGVMQ
jgi:hypothetical protein